MATNAWLLVALQATYGLAGHILPRQDSGNTAVVDLSVNNGAPQHRAAGFIYGIPDNGTQIPDHFYSDMGFNYGRFGGAQLDAGGWITGMAGYEARFQSSLNDYTEARKFGAQAILLPHDIWGTDHANSDSYWPGDNGDWTDYDNFLNQLFSDLKSNNMLEGLIYDTWNEPDGGFFWQRSQQQYLDMYIRTNKRIRGDDTLNEMLISGPSYAGQPNSGNDWWTNWFAQTLGNDSTPDQYSWHDEPGDPRTDAPNFQGLLDQFNAPSRQVNINEYATFDQQNSAGAAWWISRLERYNWQGLRGNWLSACQLRDFMASLLGKADDNDCTGTGYFGNGEYQVYKYYNQNMTGFRAGTETSGDGVIDLYTTVDDESVKVLTGVLTNTGTWYITIDNLSAVGLPESGTLNIQTYGFIDNGHMGEVDAPTDRGVYGHQYSDNSVTFPVFQTSEDEYTAWVFEFSRS